VGSDVRFGANVVVHDDVVIGDGCAILDGAVLGKAPSLAKHSTAARTALEPLVIGSGVTICTQAIVFAGTTIAAGAIIGDQAYVRERSTIGVDTVIGRGSGVDNNVTIGDRVRVQSQVYLTAYTVVEDDVFVGPCAMTTNDDHMGRHPKAFELQGAILRRACRIGGGAVLLPGVEIGEEAFVAAGAVVTSDVAARKVVMGVPARMVRDVPDEDLIERWT
jgi:UDP-2-acetamido-3-amino-2,3-dideoxy-glucuronate N-acetyltransferase